MSIQPDFSVVIVVPQGGNPSLSGCVRSVVNQEFSGIWEALVVEGGTRAQARNHGIASSSGDVVVFIDSDCTAPTGWLRSIDEGLERLADCAGLGGVNIAPEDGKVLSQAIDNVFSTFLGSLHSPSLYRPESFSETDRIACINGAFRRDALTSVGNFDVRFHVNEDTELGLKLHSAGYSLFLDPGITVWHRRRESLSQLAKQFFFYGVGRMRSMLTKPLLIDRRILVMFVASLGSLVLSLLYPPVAVYALASYVGLILLHLTRMIYARGIKRWAVLVPVLYVVIHWSYLSGLLWGLLKGKWSHPRGKSRVKWKWVSGQDV